MTHQLFAPLKKLVLIRPDFGSCRCGLTAFVDIQLDLWELQVQDQGCCLKLQNEMNEIRCNVKEISTVRTQEPLREMCLKTEANGVQGDTH